MVNIAKFEDFYKQPNVAKSVKINCSSKDLAYTVHKYKGRTLVSIFNYDYRKPVNAALQLPANAKNALTGKTVRVTNGTGNFTIPASGSLYIIY